MFINTKIKIFLGTLALFVFYGCKEVNPYDGFKAYYYGNYQKAFEIYSTACKDGDAFMCHSIGAMFENGLAVQKDNGKAYKYYLLACQQGVSYACQAIGKMCQEGKGIRHDPQKATEFYLKACDLGLPAGCYSVGSIMYNKNGSTNEEKQQAKELFGKACDLGDQKGCEIYKRLNEAGY